MKNTFKKIYYIISNTFLRLQETLSVGCPRKTWPDYNQGRDEQRRNKTMFWLHVFRTNTRKFTITDKSNSIVFKTVKDKKLIWSVSYIVPYEYFECGRVFFKKFKVCKVFTKCTSKNKQEKKNCELYYLVAYDNKHRD